MVFSMGGDVNGQLGLNANGGSDPVYNFLKTGTNLFDVLFQRSRRFQLPVHAMGEVADAIGMCLTEIRSLVHVA